MSLCKTLFRVVPTRACSLRALHTTTRCLQRSTTVLERPPLSVFQPLQDIAPTFYASGNNITPLYEPSDFYSELKVDSVSWYDNTGCSHHTLYVRLAFFLPRNVSLLLLFTLDMLKRNWYEKYTS